MKKSNKKIALENVTPGVVRSRGGVIIRTGDTLQQYVIHGYTFLDLFGGLERQKLPEVPSAATATRSSPGYAINTEG